MSVLPTLPSAPRVAVVNREFVRELFHSDRPDDAVGRYFKDEDAGLVQIVGVVANQKYLTSSEDPAPCVYFTISQQANTHTVLIVRTRPDPTGTVTGDMAATVGKLIRGQTDLLRSVLSSSSRRPACAS